MCVCVCLRILVPLPGLSSVVPARDAPLPDVVASGWLPSDAGVCSLPSPLLFCRIVADVRVCVLAVIYQFDHISQGLRAGLNG